MTVTLTLTDDQFDQIVACLMNAGGSADVYHLTFRDHENQDMRGLAVGWKQESDRIHNLLDAIHTNIIRS